ncbi:MAG: metallophosphoesterase [Nanoarchaeota archaeon]|jgi:DNA polymerase II small subunit|nr:metallophosphoesterase [Nanoarchaeota archaeon]
MKEKILGYCKENNILLDVFLLDAFSEIGEFNDIKILLKKVKNNLQKRFLTKDLILKNKEMIKRLVKDLSFGKTERFASFLNKIDVVEKKKGIESVKEASTGSVKIMSSFVKPGKAIDVKKFVTHFKNRYSELSEVIQESGNLENIMSIGKISSQSQGVSVIGMVADKKVTKNKNIILEIEDFSGRINVLINHYKKELVEEAENICLDAVVGIKGKSGDNVIFADKILLPDLKLDEKKNSEVEELALFIGDLHYGSKKFMKESFSNFIDYLNGKHENTPEVEKIKYLFVVGDLVTGLGNYPNQENDLLVKTLEGQFRDVANFFKKIRNNIQIIVIPGNHDCVRLMEPQPLFNEKYASPLYELKNIVVAENPANIKIGETGTFEGFDVLCYHGFSYPYYANFIPKLISADSMNSPENIMKYLLENRHLAPSHASNQYYPMEQDPLLIRKAPDIFVSGHTHKSAIAYKDNILLVSVSTWEGLTPYQVKLGNRPDHAKVPIVNLKTREVKLLDFEVDEGNDVYKEEFK